MSTDSADATASWLYEAVIRYLQGPMYTTPLMGFIDAKCLVFDDEEENKLEFTVVHNEFKDLVEGLLSDFLNELGVTPERFVDVVERANAERELGDFVASSILTVDDFLQFKAMMVRRNRDLTKEVLEAHGMATDGSSSTARAVTDADTDAPVSSNKETAEAAEDDGDSRRGAAESSAAFAPPMSPDSVYLAKAMRESAAQFEDEQREIERAIERARREARERERAAEEEAAKRLAAEREDAARRAEAEDAADEEEEEDFAVDDVALRRALKMSSAQFALDAVAKSERERREKILEEHERAAMAESEREARRNAPVPEFEEERVDADDGFDAGAVEQAVAMSVAQLEKDRAAAAAKAEAELEKKRLEKEREEEMERAADAALLADVQTALERSVGVAAEEAAAFERERLELERALSLSLEADAQAKRELVDAIDRDTREASSEASLEKTAVPTEDEPAGSDAAEPTAAEFLESTSTDVSDAASPRRRDGVVDRLGGPAKVPLGAEGPSDASECLASEDAVKNVGSGSLASLASLPPLTRVGALRGAGYKKNKAATVSSVPDTGATALSEEQKRHAVREAAVAAAAAQKALVIEKQLDLKRRADAAAARAALAAAEATAAAAAAAGLEDAETLERKRRFMAEQRGMLVARKAAERQRELAAHETRTHASVVAAAADKSAAAGDPKEKENVSAFPAVGKAVAFSGDAVLSEEQQRQKREALRTELARRMKSGLAARNAWGETETYV